jgi:hypothetical protein
VITFKEFVNEVTQLGPNKIVNGQVPEDLMRPIDSQGNRLVGSAAAAFERAQRDCLASVGKKLTLAGPNSSFRNIDQQNMMFRQYGAGQAAKPGRSNHGFGLSIDLQKDEAWEWFVTNSSKYGFKQLNSTNEKHHFDYIGNVAEYSGKQKILGDGSAAPPSTQGSPEQNEEPDQGGEGIGSSTMGGDVESSSDSVQGAKDAIRSGIKDIFGV